MSKYPIMNFKSPILYIGFIFLLAGAVVPILIIIKTEDFWLDEFAFALILVVLAFLIYALTGKVIIDDTSITKKTIFGTRTIRIDEIKSYGVIKEEYRLGVRIIEESEYDAFDWFAIKVLFISRQVDYNPQSFRQKDTVRIHYRKNLYEELLQKINSCKHSRYS